MFIDERCRIELLKNSNFGMNMYRYYASLVLPMFFAFSWPALGNGGRWDTVSLSHDRFANYAPVYGSTEAALHSTAALHNYLYYNYSSTAYRVVYHTGNLLGQLEQFSTAQYGLREEVFYVNRAYRRLGDHWRRYSGILDAQAQALYKNMESDLHALNSAAGGRGPVVIPTLPRA